MRQISLEAQAVVELLDMRIEGEHLDGSTEAEDVRSVLELIQSLTLESARIWTLTSGGIQTPRPFGTYQKRPHLFS